jgi:ABC-type uncharacterized transport system involved in gliding motility auxiliary subunit
MQKKQLETVLYSTGGIVALVVVLIAANFLVSFLNVRADLTEGDVYTLSPGTRSVIGKLQAPVKLRLYYTQGGDVPVGLKTFAKRVEDLLREYEAAAKGKVIVEKFNPEPDSDAEESAQLDGIEGQLTNTGEKFYFGLSIAFLDQKAAIPVLTPDRERLLEYDITRGIAQVGEAKKPVVGVMSGLPVMGRSLDPVRKQQPTEPWVLIQELKKIFDVREVKMDAQKVDDEIKVLMVIHPRNLPEETEYAIDQYVLRGGKLIAFVDPYAYFDQQPDLQNPFGGNQAGQSTFYNLFKAWGVDVDMGKVIADMSFASGEGPRLLPTLLSLNPQALNPDDVVASQVGTLLIPFGGAFKNKLAEGLKQTVLAHTSKNAQPVDLIIATLSGEPSTRGFQPTGEEMPLAVRLTGKFFSAFPEGKPKPYAPPRADKKGAEEKKAEEKPAPHLKQSAEENSMVLVADVDLLTDGAAVEIQEVFGQRVPVPRNGNLRGRGPDRLAQPRLLHQAAHGDPRDGSQRAAAVPGQDQGARGQPEPDAGEAEGYPEGEGRRDQQHHERGAAGRARQLPQDRGGDAPRAEGSPEEPARGDRPAAILYQGHQHRAGAAARRDPGARAGPHQTPPAESGTGRDMRQLA